MRPRCPLCRTAVHGASEPLSPPLDAGFVVSLKLDGDSHAGITLTARRRKDVRASQGASHADTGVRVLRCGRRDAAHAAGLRANHVIHEINGVPVAAHEAAVSVIEAVKRGGHIARCVVTKRPATCGWPAW